MSAKRFLLIVTMLIGVLLLAACGSPNGEPGAAPGDTPRPTEEAQQVAAEAEPAARAALADFLGVDEEALELEKIEDAEWPDGCLGLGGPAESCLAAVTPGYAITYNYDGEPYVVRTDLEGNTVRVEAAHEVSPGAPGEAPAAAEAAREAIAAETGVAADEIEVLSWSAEEWPSACLGLPEEGEMCAEVITPGYLVVLRAGDRVFEVRTDKSGATVRFQETADPATEYPAGVVNARQMLAAELGAPLAAIEVISFERAEWTDSCLGLGGPAESCLAAMTPGWRVMLGFEGQVYEVRTDELGETVRLAGPGAGQPGSEAPDPELGDAVVFYQRSGGIAGEVVTVRVLPDGTVERTAGLDASSETVELYMVEPARVDTLLAGLEEAGYFDLNRAYIPADTCCDRFFYLVSARAGGEVKTVEALDGTPDTPQALWDSIELIEAFIEEAMTR